MNKPDMSIRDTLFAIATGLLVLASVPASADRAQAAVLNLSLPSIYTAPPPPGVQNDLSIAQPSHNANAFRGAKAKYSRPLGYKQLKEDSSMRIRGWEVKDQIYFGQARVGDHWGLGMMMTRGDYTYGISNKGIGVLIDKEQAVYLISLDEVSVEIEF